jgi:hypothetical protein
MRRKFTLLETTLISLLLANLIGNIYLESKTTAAIAAPIDRPSSLIPVAGYCECPKTPPGGK